MKLDKYIDHTKTIIKVGAMCIGTCNSMEIKEGKI